MGYSGQSAVLKREIEAKLASRIPAALSPQALQAPRLMQSGVPEIDALLGGGIPIGGVTELTGLASSGRTSLAFSLLAEATVESACAYVDVDDTVDPKSAAAAGVSLRNLLWIRVAPVGAARTAALVPVKLSIDLATDPRRMAAGIHIRAKHIEELSVSAAPMQSHDWH
jgi:recombination protein RecA